MYNRLIVSIGLVLALFVSASAARADRIWLPEKGQLDVSPLFIYETFDEFYMGEKQTDYPPGRYQQITALAVMEYGVLDGIALDLAIGYVRAFGDPVVNDGLYDTSMGISFSILDELEWDSEWVPTLSFRFGGIIAGTYKANGLLFPGIPGDKASGIEGEFSAGKLLPHGFGVTAALGVRARSKKVPVDWHVRLSTFKMFFDAVTLSVAYDQWRSVSGYDIGAPFWTPDRFRELREDTGNIEAAVGFGDPWGAFWSFYYARTVTGRNTGIKNVAGMMITVPIDLSHY